MSWDGPGSYRHYKRNRYEALGVAEHESTGQRFVIYISDSIEHTAERLARGSDFIARPLDIQDCQPRPAKDPWNAPVQLLGGVIVERFTKVAE